ncbi:hypothetical protein [Dyella terrae]|uniref:hypothetical protein n=1 Tax=Dyella terrae TaxID=522259 RepID=UPI001EFE2015|nr:hypothetical protein [Dyella terrae]ULU27746.1 hypothetical protein DYST_04712 [Dyella terrae]
MTSINPNDSVVYHVVIDGLDPEALQMTLRQFSTRQAGARPHDLNHYVSVTCDLAQIEQCLAWAVVTISGRFQGIQVKASIGTDLSWTEFTVPPEFLGLASKYGAELKVFFASKYRTPVVDSNRDP